MTDLHDLNVEKLAHARALEILDDRVLTRIAMEFGADALRRSSALHGLGRFLDQTGLRGEHVVEIGTFNGVTAAVLSRYFCRVTSVDVKSSPLKAEIVRALRLTNVRFCEVRDNAEKADLVSRLSFDAAYVDGDHAHDAESDFALVRGCGRVLFHEAWPQQQPVWNLVRSLPPAEVALGGPCFALWRRGSG